MQSLMLEDFLISNWSMPLLIRGFTLQNTLMLPFKTWMWLCRCFRIESTINGIGVMVMWELTFVQVLKKMLQWILHVAYLTLKLIDFFIFLMYHLNQPSHLLVMFLFCHHLCSGDLHLLGLKMIQVTLELLDLWKHLWSSSWNKLYLLIFLAIVVVLIWWIHQLSIMAIRPLNIVLFRN